MTIKEIAKLAGVSISTVSKIVNNKDESINPKTRDRVLKLVKEYNYSPYSGIKTLVNAKSFVLAVLFKNSDYPVLMLNGILESASKRGYNILLLDSKNSNEDELKNITAICKNKVDGVIWEPVNKESVLYESYFTEQNICVTYVNTSESPASFNVDFGAMGYQMTQKMLDLKHVQIGCLVKENSFRSRKLLEGYKKCLYNAQIPFDSKLLFETTEENYFQELLRSGVSGVISSHFSSALYLYESMHKQQYSVPTDLSIVSFRADLKEENDFSHISSLGIPYHSFGSYVGQVLIDKCEKSQETNINTRFFSENQKIGDESIDIPAFLRSKKILVVGSINTDITFNVDGLPQVGKTTQIINSTTTLGGKGANQAVGVAKMGAEVALIGEIGDDADATFIIDTLAREHVSTQGVHSNLKEQTGKAYIYIEKSGESTITISAGANAILDCKAMHKREHLFKNTGFCLISTEIPFPTVMQAAQTARKNQVKNIIKPAALKALPQELLRLSDIFIPNKKEASTLCPHYDTVEEQANYFYENGAAVVIITLGSAGSYLKTAETQKFFPTSKLITVDTTGGADAFISTLATYLLVGYSIEKAIKIATYSAGFCVSRQGVIHALADKNTLENHIKRLEAELLDKE